MYLELKKEFGWGKKTLITWEKTILDLIKELKAKQVIQVIQYIFPSWWLEFFHRGGETFCFIL